VFPSLSHKRQSLLGERRGDEAEGWQSRARTGCCCLDDGRSTCPSRGWESPAPLNLALVREWTWFVEGMVCVLPPTHSGTKGAWQQVSLSVVWLGVSGEGGSDLLLVESLLVKQRSTKETAGFPAGKCPGLAGTWAHPLF